MGMCGYYFAVDKERMNQILTGEEEIPSLADEEFQMLDVDKSWDKIQFILCRTPFNGQPPMGYVVPMSEETMIPESEEVFDFGAYCLFPEQVSRACEYLCSISDDDFKEKFSMAELEECEIVGFGECDEELYEYVFGYFKELQKFLKSAKDNDKCIIFYAL